MLRRILAIAVLVFSISKTYANPGINTFNASPVSSGNQIKVSTTAATAVNFTVTVSRGINPATGSFEGVSMTMNIVLRGGGAAEEVLAPAVSVSTADFNGGPYAYKTIAVSIPANKQNRTVSLKYTYLEVQTGLLVGPFYSSTYFVTVLTTGNPPTNPETRIRLVPNVRRYTEYYRENNSYAYLPPNTVMTGRYHTGDENGTTRYEYATLIAINPAGEVVPGTVTVEEVGWSAEIKESGNFYVVPANHVMTGRIHVGDENQKTSYRFSVVKFNGQSTTIPQTVPNGGIDVVLTDESKTSSWPRPVEADVMAIYGRGHWGDENGRTEYYFGPIFVNP